VETSKEDIEAVKQMAEKQKDPYLMGIYMILDELMYIREYLEKNK